MSQARPMRLFRSLRKLEKLFADLLDLTSLIGLGFSLFWIVTFLTTSPNVTVNQGGVLIQGVPFSWVVFGFVATSAAHAYRSLKAFLHSVGVQDLLLRIEHGGYNSWRRVFYLAEPHRASSRTL